MPTKRVIRITETKVYIYDQDVVDNNLSEYVEAALGMEGIDPLTTDDNGNPVVTLELAMQIDQKLVENGDTAADELASEVDSTDVKFEIVEVEE